jgi:hypothetical protein
MKELLFDSISMAYAATGFVSLIGYWPTIKDLYHHKKPSANISSYILWSATAGIGFLYAIFVLPDLPLRFVYGVNFFACLTVLILSLRLLKKDGPRKFRKS